MHKATNSSPKPMVFFLRHGERSDCVAIEESEKIEIAIDPHLTDLGKLQSKYAAIEVQKMVSEHINKPVKYLIVSSPFLRCLQTGYHMIQVFGKDNIIGQKIYYDNFLSEFSNQLYFAKYPIDDIFVNSRPQDLHRYLDIDLQEGLFNKGEHIAKVNYPESPDSLYERVTNGYKKALEKYETTLKNEENVVLILITHGYGIQFLLEYFDAFDLTKGIEYTCLTQVFYDIDTKQGTVGNVQHHDQLEKAENEYKKLQQK